MAAFTGIFPALVTPFASDGTLDTKALARLIERNIEQGVDGFYISGSTGESFMMTNEQRKVLASEVMRIVSGRVEVIANVGSFSLDQALDMAVHAKKAGLAAISSVPPFYFPFSKAEIRDYYLALQKLSAMPLIIYNIPKMSGVSFSTDDLLELLSHDGVIGIKQTTLDLFQTETIIRKMPDKSVFNGHDEIFLPALSIGARAMIGSTASIMPEKFRQIIDAFQRGDIAEAQRIQGVVNSVVEKLLRVGIFKGVKAVLQLQGLDCGVCKRPFMPLDDAAMSIVKAAYTEIVN
ncbi:MAG: N-acetylneuraminate lyase [Planctomycetes bacterium]|nr:N-acetylneuraminate lyase [Planctomycetota bacterium]